MTKIYKFLKENVNIFIFISLISIGLIITFTNLSITFNLSLTSKNKDAISALNYLSKFPEGLILIYSKNQTIFTKDEILKIKEWLDKEGKSKSEITVYDNNKINININYLNDFDLAKYLNKLFLIPYMEIENIKISNIEKQIKINFLFNPHKAK